MTLLLRAVAGSHLYGTNHAGSDHDYYEVHDKLHINRKKHTIQTIKNGLDVIQTDLSTWMINCENGSHQALDCLWADDNHVELDIIGNFRASYRPNIPKTVNSFRRVIKSFHDGTLKQRRHAVRMEWCVEDMIAHGFYNPTLTPEKIELLSRVV